MMQPALVVPAMASSQLVTDHLNARLPDQTGDPTKMQATRISTGEELFGSTDAHPGQVVASPVRKCGCNPSNRIVRG